MNARWFLPATVICAIVSAGPDEAEWDGFLRDLGNNDIKVREEAFSRFLEWGAADPERILALLPESHQDPEIRDSCRKLRTRIPWESAYRGVAARVSDPAFLAAVRGLFANPEREALLSFIKTYGHWRQTAFALIPFLKMQSVNMRLDAVQALGKLMCLDVFREIQPLLDDKDPETREHAALALLGYGDSEAVDRIVRLLHEDKDIHVREMALYVLHNTDVRKMASVLGTLLDDPEPWMRQAALHKVWYVKDLDPSLPGRVESFLGDKEPVVRSAALEALPHPVKIRIVAPLLKDPDRNVRFKAACVVGQMATPEAVESLIGFSREADPFDRLVAAQTLPTTTSVTSPCMIRLAELLDDPDEKVRTRAAHRIVRRLGKLDIAEVDVVAKAKLLWDRQVQGVLPETDKR